MLSPTKIYTLSLHDALPIFTLAVSGAGTALAQATVTAAGQLIAGGRLSLTVIVCVQVWLLPQASVARQVRVRVNWLTQLLALMLSPTKLITGVPPQLSLAVTLAVSGAGSALSLHDALPIYWVITGGVVSLTVIVCVQVWLLPQASVAR